IDSCELHGLDQEPGVGPRLGPECAVVGAPRLTAGAWSRTRAHEPGEFPVFRIHGAPVVGPSFLVGLARLRDSGVPPASGQAATALRSSAAGSRHNLLRRADGSRERAANAV